MKPDFIGLGAQKSGTSWIYANLEAHPGICIPRKEIHFFSRERNYEQGIQWYRNLFGSCREGQLGGEFCTSYLYCAESAQRIHVHCPGAKLLAVLRNPADRAFSNYKNDIMAGKVDTKTGFWDALKAHSEYLEQGYYAGQLEAYFHYFHRDQIFIMIYEDIEQDPQAFMKSIYEFLGVDNTFVSPHLYQRINPSYVPKNQSFEKFINTLASGLERLGRGGPARVIKKTGIHKLIRRGNRAENQALPVLEKKDREELLKGFNDSILRLEALMGRGLEKWKI